MATARGASGNGPESSYCRRDNRGGAGRGACASFNGPLSLAAGDVTGGQSRAGAHSDGSQAGCLQRGYAWHVPRHNGDQPRWRCQQSCAPVSGKPESRPVLGEGPDRGNFRLSIQLLQLCWGDNAGGLSGLRSRSRTAWHVERNQHLGLQEEARRVRGVIDRSAGLRLLPAGAMGGRRF